MSNPWIKKNPFMSMWMSGANAMLGFARGHGHVAARRQASAMTAAATDQVTRFWSSLLKPAPVPKLTRRKSRKSGR